MKSEAQTRQGRSTGPQSENHKLVISLCVHVDGGQKKTGAVFSQCRLSVARKAPNGLGSWSVSPRDPPASSSLELNYSYMPHTQQF